MSILFIAYADMGIVSYSSSARIPLFQSSCSTSFPSGSRVTLAALLTLIAGACVHPRYVEVPDIGRGLETLTCAPDLANESRAILECQPLGLHEMRGLEEWLQADTLPTHQHLALSLDGFRSSAEAVSSGVLSPDGKRVVFMIQGVQEPTRSVVVHDLRSGELIATLEEVHDLTFEPGMLVFSPDGQRIAASGGEESIGIFAAGTGRLLGRLRFGGCESWAGSAHRVSAAFSKDGRRVLTATAGGEVTLWDGVLFTPIWRRCIGSGRDVQWHLKNAQFLPGDVGLLVLGSHGLEQWSIEGDHLGFIPVPAGELPIRRGEVHTMVQREPNTLAVSRDGRTIVVGGLTYDHESGPYGFSRWLLILSLDSEKGRFRIRQTPVWDGYIWLSPNGRWVAGMSNDDIYVLDTRTGVPRLRIARGQTLGEGFIPTHAISFSPDGRYLYTYHNHRHPMVRWTLEPAAR